MSTPFPTPSAPDSGTEASAPADRAANRIVGDRREFRLSVKIALLCGMAVALFAVVAVDFLRPVIGLRYGF